MDLEQALAAIEELKTRVETLETEKKGLDTEVSKLRASKQGLMSDLKKRKNVVSFLKVAGIELKDDASEEEIAEQIAALKAPAAAPSGDAGESAATGGEQGATGQQQPAQQQPAQGQGQPSPSDVMTAAVESKLNSLQQQNQKLASLLDEITKDRDREREQRRQARIEQEVMAALAKAECRRPHHLLKLERENFDLIEEENGESMVVFKAGDEMIKVGDAVARLKEDDEYSPYFNGSGATGSGMAPNRTTSPVITNNPFAVGSVNATEAAKLYNDNPERAKQLINQARSAGKLDATLGRVFADS